MLGTSSLKRQFSEYVQITDDFENSLLVSNCAHKLFCRAKVQHPGERTTVTTNICPINYWASTT